jgi:uncharacterized SAM-binding protein YcdF (DUF218 family)
LTLLFTKFLMYPLGAAILGGATALALSFTKWHHLGQALLGVVLICLWLAATPALASWLNWCVASQVPALELETLPPSDAVILLGGGSWGQILHARRIYLAGKAPRIVISGGDLHWLSPAASEAQQMADFLVELGVPRSALILETKSSTTRENAVNTAVIFKAHGWRTGILVTSGVHMPRALGAFRKVGIDVVSPTYISGPPQVDSLLYLLPDVNALASTTLAIKEMMGLRVYRLRGWA